MDDNWDFNDARVVCRELGFPGAIVALSRASFGAGSADQLILLDEVKCIGTETNLLNCSHAPFGGHDCSHSEDASVICTAHCKLHLLLFVCLFVCLILFTCLFTCLFII